MGDPLSQEEIDRLLAEAKDEGAEEATAAETPPEAQAAADESELEPAPATLEVVATAESSENAPQPKASSARHPRKSAEVLGAVSSTGPTSVQPVQFGQLPGARESADAPRQLDILMDVRLQLTVELGRKNLTIKDALSLGPGSVVELDKVAGEPVDLLVNNKLIARGEVVVIDENFGIRVTEVVGNQERAQRVA